MASSGPRSCGLAANDASHGTTAWSGVTAVYVEDGSYAVANSGTRSQYLKCTTFGFAIPAGATIDGIQFDIKCVYYPGTQAVFERVRAVKGGVIGATNLGAGTIAPFFTPAFVTWGGPTQLWGLSWTADDINASDFGMAMNFNNAGKGTLGINVDLVRATVYYTAGGGGGGTVFSYGYWSSFGRPLQHREGF